MDKRTIPMNQAKLPKPKEERFPKRKQEENGYTKRALELLDEEAKKFPLYNVSMQVDHQKGTVTFNYVKRDLEWEHLKHRIDETLFQCEISRIEKSLLKGGKK